MARDSKAALFAWRFAGDSYLQTTETCNYCNTVNLFFFLDFVSVNYIYIYLFFIGFFILTGYIDTAIDRTTSGI